MLILYTIDIIFEISGCNLGEGMIRLFLLNKCYSISYGRRSGGMADASDSKSDVGDYVWVQVPSPALEVKSRKSEIL